MGTRTCPGMLVDFETYRTPFVLASMVLEVQYNPSITERFKARELIGILDSHRQSFYEIPGIYEVARS